MKKPILKISNILLIVFVLFLSMGVNVSKMKCDNNTLYIGTQVPSCSEKKEIACLDEQKKISCCLTKNQKSCCPETMDDSCASSTKNIHFSFETLIPSCAIDFENKYSSMCRFLFYAESYALKHQFTFVVKLLPLPPNLIKPKLADIQSFLL